MYKGEIQNLPECDPLKPALGEPALAKGMGWTR